MDEPLPLLISIPHGGLEVPDCVKDRVALTEADILEDADAFTREIYDFGERVHTVLRADIARAIVDLNRDTTQLGADHPDGVIKSVTCYNKPVYRPGCFPDRDLIDKLIRDYHKPFHDKIRLALQNDEIAMGLDCHSMAAQGPPTAKDRGRRRPMINIGNVMGRSCSMDHANELAGCFRDIMDLSETDVKINEPFSGGFITRSYATAETPWIQIEISRAIYLRPPWFDQTTLAVSHQRLSELNCLMWQVIQRFWSRIAGC